MSNDPADKLAAPSFGFKKKREAGAKPEKAKPKATQAKARPVNSSPETAQPAEAQPAKVSAKTQVLEKEAAPVIAPEPPAEKAPKKQKPPKAAKPAKEPRAPKQPREPKEPRERRINIGTPSGLSAAVMIGAIVGAFMALAIWFSGTVSQWTRGTSSLGDKGAIVLIAVFVLAVVVGGYLLRLAGARSPFTISFLGSALVAVLSMLFLTGLFAHAWGVIVAVILTAAAYALAYWVTTNYID